MGFNAHKDTLFVFELLTDSGRQTKRICSYKKTLKQGNSLILLGLAASVLLLTRLDQLTSEVWRRGSDLTLRAKRKNDCAGKGTFMCR